jgi:hypothetical protein
LTQKERVFLVYIYIANLSLKHKKMSNTLSEISRTRNVTGSSIVTEDYDTHFRLCRSGLWVGVENTFTETVTVSYEHSDDVFAVGWRINGVTIVDPGYSSSTPPWGDPVPGVPGVIYKCPVDTFFHRISFTSTSGMDEQCFYVQVLYRGVTEADVPPHAGPTLYICISGHEIEWPADKLEEEANCLAAFFEKLNRYKLIRKVWPPEPVEWLRRFQGEEVQLLKAMINSWEHVNHEKQPILSKMLEESIVNSLQAHALGSTRLKTK